MIDVTTRQRILVHDEGGKGGPYIMLPLDQLDAVEALLRANDVYFWTDSHSISLDGNPAFIVINLGRGADAGQVQRLLDAAG